ncbi:MAG TPA: hypothetical protein VEI24_07040 [Nitrospiria bacterium]|nr:hypothetical protein [Nitrospiria bacterium]
MPKIDTRSRELLEEDARLRRVRLLVESACYRLRRQVATPREAVDVIVDTKARVLELFPDKAAQFDLIYLPRLLRIVRARWGTVQADRREPAGTLT